MQLRISEISLRLVSYARTARARTNYNDADVLRLRVPLLVYPVRLFVDFGDGRGL